eukprot:5472745-Pyramimonas_sp.AAC.1
MRATAWRCRSTFPPASTRNCCMSTPLASTSAGAARAQHSGGECRERGGGALGASCCPPRAPLRAREARGRRGRRPTP